MTTQSRKIPRPGGHSPSDVRHAFLELLEEYANGAPIETTLDVRGRPTNLAQVFGLLWNYSDALPRDAFETMADLRPQVRFSETPSALTHPQLGD
jgi:hypothetical protein